MEENRSLGFSGSPEVTENLDLYRDVIQKQFEENLDVLRLFRMLFRNNLPVRFSVLTNRDIQELKTPNGLHIKFLASPYFVSGYLMEYKLSPDDQVRRIEITTNIATFIQMNFSEYLNSIDQNF